MFTMDENDIFMGSPRSKFYDIIYNANKNLVADEIDNLLARYVILEKMLEERGVNVDDIDKTARSYVVEHDISNETNSLYLELTGNIVTRNE